MAEVEEYRCFVGGLSRNTTDQGFEDAFRSFGNVLDAKGTSQYLVLMLMILLILAGFIIFIFVVTAQGGGYSVAGQQFQEYTLDDYSPFIRHKLNNPTNWVHIQSCIESNNNCDELNNIQSAADYYNSDLNPIQSGCCRPPTESDQSFLFLGDGSEDGKLAPGTLCVLTHKDKEVSNALEGAGIQASDVEIVQEVAAMSRTNMYRPGRTCGPDHLEVPREKTEMVGSWKAKIYDMHNVQVGGAQYAKIWSNGCDC